MQLFSPLLVGGRLVVATPQGHTDAPYLTALCERRRVTVLSSVNSLAQLFLEAGDAAQLADLRVLLVGGEMLTAALTQLVHRALPGIRLVNGYGERSATQGPPVRCTPRTRAVDASQLQARRCTCA